MDELGGQPSTGTDRDRDRQAVRPGPAGHSARTGLALGALALNTAGRPALALTGNASHSPSGPFVALGAANGTFATPDAVGPGGSQINGETLAFSPRSGQPTLVWTQFKTVLASTRR